METSRNQYLGPMRGTVERETKRAASKAAMVRSIIAGLVTHVTADPFPAMSDHYRAPEPEQQQQRFAGFNAMGDYVPLTEPQDRA